MERGLGLFINFLLIGVIIHRHGLVKVKSAFRPILAHQVGAYPGFCSMKRLGVFLLPPGWDASPSQCYPEH